MTVDRERLRALAQAATPGPWNTVEYLSAYRVREKFGLHSDTAKTAFGTTRTHQDAAYIAAASPDVVLALLAALQAAEAREAALLRREAILLAFLAKAENASTWGELSRDAERASAALGQTGAAPGREG